MNIDLDTLRRSVAYDADAKKAFHAAAKKYLRRLLKELGTDYGAADPIRSNMGGIAVSGEVTLHCDGLYVQVSQSCMGDAGTVMFRSCKSRKDYTGGINNFANAETLIDTMKLANLIRSRIPKP